MFRRFCHESLTYIPGVVTQDMLPELGNAFVDVFGEGEKGWGASAREGKL